MVILCGFINLVLQTLQALYMYIVLERLCLKHAVSSDHHFIPNAARHYCFVIVEVAFCAVFKIVLFVIYSGQSEAERGGTGFLSSSTFSSSPLQFLALA